MALDFLFVRGCAMALVADAMLSRTRYADRSLFVALAVIVLMGLGGCAAKQPTKTASAVPADPGQRRQTVAVFPFENYAVEKPERLAFMSDWVPDSISEKLLQTGELRVVERQKLVEILREQNLGASGLADPSTRATLGRISGAQTMIFGAFSSFGDRFQMDARVVDTESGLVLKTVSSQGGLKDARAVTSDLANQLVAGLGLEIAREAAEANLIDDVTVRSVEAYYQGVASEKAGDVDGAIDAYQRSLELNPDDTEVRDRLKRLLL